MAVNIFSNSGNCRYSAFPAVSYILIKNIAPDTNVQT